MTATDNTINMPNSLNSYGFYALVCPETIISDNTVNVYSKSTKFMSGIYKGGSFFNTVDNLMIHENNTFNSTIEVLNCKQAGIFDNYFYYSDPVISTFESSVRNLFCNNTFEGKNSLKLKSGCSPTYLGTSTFNQLEGGLEIDRAGIFNQVNQGNVWNETSYASKINDDNTQFYANLYYNPCEDLDYFPETILPNDEWFHLYSGCISCTRNFSIFNTFLDGNDILVIENEGLSDEYLNWQQRLTTFKKLWESPELMEEDSLAEIYYLSCLNSDIEYIVKTHAFLSKSRYHQTYSPLLKVRYDTKFEILDEIFDLNELLISAFDSTNSANLFAKITQLNSVQTQINQILDYLEIHRNAMLDSAIYYNDLIEGSGNTYSEFEQFINSFAIEREQNPNFELDSIEYTNVLELAILCPIVYGKAVFLAQTFIPIQELDEELDGIDPCAEEITLGNMNNFQNRLLQVFPNPVGQDIQIPVFNNLQFKHYIIFNSFGIQEMAGSVSNQIEISQLLSGLYYIQLTDQLDQIHVGKFIKQ